MCVYVYNHSEFDLLSTERQLCIHPLIKSSIDYHIKVQYLDHIRGTRAGGRKLERFKRDGFW